MPLIINFPYLIGLV